MAEAAARREARRKRILENADNRLRRITNLNSSACKTVDEDDSIKDIKDPLNPSPPTPGDVLHVQPEPELSYLAPETKEHLQTPLEPTGDQVHQPDRLDSEVALAETAASSYRFVVLVLLGLSVRYANLIADSCADLIGFDLAFLHIETIFGPFVCYEIAGLILFRPPPEESPTFNLLLSLNRVDPKMFARALRALGLVLGVLADVSVYFFAFVSVDLVFSVVGV